MIAWFYTPDDHWLRGILNSALSSDETIRQNYEQNLVRRLKLVVGYLAVSMPLEMNQQLSIDTVSRRRQSRRSDRSDNSGYNKCSPRGIPPARLLER
jgi:hypothetical protein